MLKGYKKYEILGESYSKLYKKMLEQNICAKEMYEKKGILYLKLSEEFCKDFEKICMENDYEINIKQEKGLTHFFRLLKKRPGIVAGFIVSVCLIVYFSDVALDIRILTGNESMKEKIKQAMYSEGIKPGCYIPDINFVVSERNIRQKTDEISWVGITRKGSVLLVDYVENIPKSKGVKRRLPSNLVACEDGVIDKMEVKDGQVKCKEGDGVTKGEILVSGEEITKKSKWVDGKEKIETKINYTRSFGEIYGTFERQITFRQNYKMERKKNTGKTKKVTYINYFSADLPLFTKLPEGFYETKSKTKALKIFGIETPVKFTECTLDEYEFKTEKLDENAVKEILGDKIYKYEKNFLDGYEIKSRNVNYKKDKNGISATVNYTLYGNICKETEFFVHK